MTNEELVKMAEEAMENAYSPYSKFKVGAALAADDGSVYTGCNIENSSFGATICAERTAIVKAVSEGKRKFEKIAIVSSSGDTTYPCGICRQVMSEFMIDAEVVFKDKNGNIIVEKVKDLIPKSFVL
ncbi:MAG: cytidine deaminase [Firmicutes bacterium]|nr:cytidine deaminase [Bacillota bacterium]